MKNLKNKINYVLNGEDGASNVELIVWFSVVFVIATFLFIFRGAIEDFITNATNRVGDFGVE